MFWSQQLSHTVPTTIQESTSPIKPRLKWCNSRTRMSTIVECNLNHRQGNQQTDQPVQCESHPNCPETSNLQKSANNHLTSSCPSRRQLVTNPTQHASSEKSSLATRQNNRSTPPQHGTRKHLTVPEVPKDTTRSKNLPKSSMTQDYSM
ncbi:hypothetical protein Dimus_039308 [Dionaea muscipula]